MGKVDGAVQGVDDPAAGGGRVGLPGQTRVSVVGGGMGRRPKPPSPALSSARKLWSGKAWRIIPMMISWHWKSVSVTGRWPLSW